MIPKEDIIGLGIAYLGIIVMTIYMIIWQHTRIDLFFPILYLNLFLILIGTINITLIKIIDYLKK